METWNFVCDSTSSKAALSKRGTSNKRWKVDFDSFLVSILVEQVRKGLKRDKPFKQAAFAHASTINARFNTDFTIKNVDNYYRTFKAWYMEIKKAKDLSGVGWDVEIKMIMLDPIVALTYVKVRS